VAKKKEIKKKEKYYPEITADDVNSSLRDLIRHIPLLGFIIIKMKWKFDKRVPTAGISKNFQLYLNKEFFKTLTPKERVAVLKHESLHLAHRHFDRLLDVSQPHIAEIAKEISINQYIDGLPGTDFPTVEMFNLDRNLSLEEYYKRLLKQAQKNPDKIMCAHGNNPLKGDAEQIKGNNISIGEKICNDAKDYAKGIGKETSDLYEKVQIIPTDYKAKINSLVGCQPSTTKIKRTNSRRSKRYAKSPGIKKELELGSAIMGLDTSGSMNKEELAKAIDVAKKLRNKCANLWLIQGDTEVKEISKIKKNIKELGIKGRGGTELTPIIEKAKEFGYPKLPLIMFTDGEVWDYPSKKDLRNSVWVFTREDTARSFHKQRPGVPYAVLL